MHKPIAQSLELNERVKSLILHYLAIVHTSDCGVEMAKSATRRTRQTSPVFVTSSAKPCLTDDETVLS